MTIHILSELPTLLPSRDSSQQQQQQPSTTIGPSQSQDPIIRKRETNVEIHFQPPLSNGLSHEKGDLYITESQLIWWSGLSNSGVAIDYPTIIIHAISRTNDRVVQRPCIYAQLHAEDANGDEEEDNEDEIIDTIEMRLVPENDRNRK
jgi:chloride channel, nucleotide-sensitive, 1A